MRGGRPARSRGEAGFTLVEVLVVTVILGVIGFVLTEAIILGLKTTDGTAANSSRSVATQALASFFTDDAQSADTVSTADTACATEPVFVHLAWTDHGVARSVSYSLDPATGDDQDVIRWSCTGAGSPDRRILGHFTRAQGAAAVEPVVVHCGTPLVDCPATPSVAPATITLDIAAAPPVSLTVRRRTAP